VRTLNKESCENQERARRCNRIRSLQNPTGIKCREGAEKEKPRKSEDRPGQGADDLEDWVGMKILR